MFTGLHFHTDCLDHPELGYTCLECGPKIREAAHNARFMTDNPVFCWYRHLYGPFADVETCVFEYLKAYNSGGDHYTPPPGIEKTPWEMKTATWYPAVWLADYQAAYVR